MDFNVLKYQLVLMLRHTSLLAWTQYNVITLKRVKEEAVSVIYIFILSGRPAIAPGGVHVAGAGQPHLPGGHIHGNIYK